MIEDPFIGIYDHGVFTSALLAIFDVLLCTSTCSLQNCKSAFLIGELRQDLKSDLTKVS